MDCDHEEWARRLEVLEGALGVRVKIETREEGGHGDNTDDAGARLVRAS